MGESNNSDDGNILIYSFDGGIKPDHDYDPSWDYEVSPLTDGQRTIINQSGHYAMKHIVSALDLPGFILFTTKLPPDHVALYISGTSSYPVLGLDINQLIRLSDGMETSLVEEITLSIAHELGHAFQERCGHLEEEHLHKENEDAAEMFARNWVENGVVDISILRGISGAA